MVRPRRPLSAGEGVEEVGPVSKYARMYRFGITPWERYRTAAAASIGALLDREEAGRTRPLGRALDLGCGRGQYTSDLARRGWQAVGVDSVPSAVADAARREEGSATYVVGDVTDLPAADLGTFDFFLDIGCFQGLGTKQQQAEGAGVTALANPGATLLMLAFGPTWMRSVLEGVSQDEVERAFPTWQLLAVEAADTRGLGWPMSRSRPQWYRLGRRASP
jgi:cyclopropane fatty-acyl-phospholipid synthase-like methyltransferase